MAVLGEWFRRQNVSCVPSLLGAAWCQMGQVQGTRLDLSGWVAHLSKWCEAQRRELSGKVGQSGDREQRQNEDQGQKPEVDVGVPGSAGFAANVFRVGIAGGVRPFCRGVRGYRFGGRKRVHAASWLGIGRRSLGGKPAPDHGCYPAARRCDRGSGATAVSSSGLCTSPLDFY